MRRLVDYWFAEEREHSRLLGCAVDRLGGKNFIALSFTVLLPPRTGCPFRLQVLLLTEITSTAYYACYSVTFPIPALASMCALFCAMKAAYIAFHQDRLAAADRSGSQAGAPLVESSFCLCGYAAATMLAESWHFA
jgi:hypothetical protein